jgi:RNA polymerase sigma factor (sigma-70 family)
VGQAWNQLREYSCIMGEARKAFVERLIAHRGALQAFFLRRLRTKSDAADLVQEVYLRMLRVKNPDSILNPEGYLFTIAGNLLKENAAADRRQAQAADVEEADLVQPTSGVQGFDTALDSARRVERLSVVLKELSPKCCAAVILQYRHGLSYQQIGERLGISPRMVKKYLTQALNHCRRRMARLR